MAVGGGEDDHVFLVAAGGEEDLILGVEGEAGASSAFAGDIVFAGHLHGVGVDDCDGVFVFNVDVDFAVAIGDGLLRCAADIDGSEDGAVFIVENGNVGRGVAEDVEVVVIGIVEIAVGIALDIDLFDDCEGPGVEHGDGFGGGESVAGGGIDCSAVGAGAGDVADRGESVEVEDADMSGGSGACYIEIAAVGIGGDIVESAIAADKLDLEHFVGTRVWGWGLCRGLRLDCAGSEGKQDGEGCGHLRE